MTALRPVALRCEHQTAPSESLTQLRFDTAGHSAASIEFALRLLGPSSILLGTDFPLVAPDDLGASVTTVRSAVTHAGSRRLVLGSNASRLLDL